VPRARNEFDPNTFEVVIGIVERLNLEFASITGAGIDMADAECAPQDIQQISLESLDDWKRLR